MEHLYQDRIRQKLTAALQPIHLEIKDESKMHAGHAGHDPQGETHFFVAVVSSLFEGKALLERHRIVYAALTDELKERVHALTLKLSTPDEYEP